MMKFAAVIFFSCVALMASANMASPVIEGTHAASAFSSSDIDILQENIRIQINSDFTKAHYIINYNIQNDKSGKQIPLLFYAADFAGSFTVYLDDIPMQLLDIAQSDLNIRDSIFSGYTTIFGKAQTDNGPLSLTWFEDAGYVIEIADLQYFIADISAGTHIIRVEYDADAWVNRSDWVKQYSFRYALAPAKQWRSFQNLTVTIDSADPNNIFSTNLGNENLAPGTSIQQWKFKEIPSDFILISFTPDISKKAHVLLNLQPVGIAIILSCIAALLHIVFVIRYRKKNQNKKRSWVLIAGSLINPLLFLIFYLYAFTWIDSAIGTHASKYHGYTFLVLLLYPVIMPLYWGILYLIDKYVKRQYTV